MSADITSNVINILATMFSAQAVLKAQGVINHVESGLDLRSLHNDCTSGMKADASLRCIPGLFAWAGEPGGTASSVELGLGALCSLLAIYRLYQANFAS
tara:strand:+ start:355 stop:651 length:297 start_codon:yes stop_codon:yes gene_type:complete